MKEYLPPTWIAFPAYTPGDFPPPDGSKQFGFDWLAFYHSLSQNERLQYERDYPEPPEWKGFYDGLREGIQGSRGRTPQDLLRDIWLEAARSCRDKAVAVITDARLTPEERGEAREALEKMARDSEEKAKCWYEGRPYDGDRQGS